MLPGKYTIKINGDDWLKGVSNGPFDNDGVFQYNNISDSGANFTSIAATNVITNPGILYPQNPDVLDSISLDGDIVARCKSFSYVGANNFFLTSTGKIYSDYGGTLTFLIQDTTVGRTYQAGSCDMVVYNYNIYISSGVGTSKQVSKISVSSFDGTYLSSDFNWWTGTMGKTLTGVYGTFITPLHVFENNLWIGDGNNIHKYDQLAGVASTNVLSLNSDQLIIALETDPNSGKMMVSTTVGANADFSRATLSKMLFWDGFSPKPSRAIIVDSPVSAMYTVSGMVYMIYGAENLGYWAGSGIKLLRKLIGNKYGGVRGFKTTITSLHNILYVLDGTLVLMFGELKGGADRVWNVAYNPLHSESFSYGGTLSSVNIFSIQPSDYNNITIQYTLYGTAGTKRIFTKYPIKAKPTIGQSLNTNREIKTTIFDMDGKLVKIKAIKTSWEFNTISNNTYPIAINVYNGNSSRTINFSTGNQNYNNKYNTDRFYFPSSQEDSQFYDFYLGLNFPVFYSGLRTLTIYYDIIE